MFLLSVYLWILFVKHFYKRPFTQNWNFFILIEFLLIFVLPLYIFLKATSCYTAPRVLYTEGYLVAWDVNTLDAHIVISYIFQNSFPPSFGPKCMHKVHVTFPYCPQSSSGASAYQHNLLFATRVGQDSNIQTNNKKLYNIYCFVDTPIIFKIRISLFYLNIGGNSNLNSGRNFYFIKR